MSHKFLRTALFTMTICLSLNQPARPSVVRPVVKDHLQTQAYSELPQLGVSNNSSLAASTPPAVNTRESASTQHGFPLGNLPPVQHPQHASGNLPDIHVQYLNAPYVYGSHPPHPPSSPVIDNLGSLVPSVVYQLPFPPPHSSSLPIVYPSAQWSQHQPPQNEVRTPLTVYPQPSVPPSPQIPYHPTLSVLSPHPHSPPSPQIPYHPTLSVLSPHPHPPPSPQIPYHPTLSVLSPHPHSPPSPQIPYHPTLSVLSPHPHPPPSPQIPYHPTLSVLSPHPHPHPHHVIYVLSHPPQPVNYPSHSPATIQQPQPFHKVYFQSPPTLLMSQTRSPSHVTHQPSYVSLGVNQLSHSSKDTSYTPQVPQTLQGLPALVHVVPSSATTQRPRNDVVKEHVGSSGGFPGNEQSFRLSQHEAGISQAEWNGSLAGDPLSREVNKGPHSFPEAALHMSPLQMSSLSLPADGQPQNRPAAAYNDVGAAASPVFEAAAAAGSKNNASVAASPSGDVNPTFKAAVVTSPRYNENHAANPARLGLPLARGGISQSLVSVILAPQVHAAAQTLAADVGLVQYYEAHGCVDPLLHLPYGASSMGLALGCWAPQSQLLCQTIGQSLTNGRSPGSSVMRMMAPQAARSLLEMCLSQSTISRVLTSTSSRQNAAADPLLTMTMLAGAEGEPVLQALALMNVLGGNSATSGAGGSRNRSTAGATGRTQLAATSQSPSSAARGQGPELGSDLMSQCQDILLLLTMRTDAVLTSSEGMEAVTDLRRQLMPFQCQEMAAGNMPFRMCCPGRVHAPSFVDITMVSLA